MESFRALLENFLTLKYFFRVLDFRVRKFSNMESFGALKLSNLAMKSMHFIALFRRTACTATPGPI
jgi:hypothetical protein